MAISSWYASELPSISVSDQKPSNNNQLSDKINSKENQSSVTSQSEHRNHHHRHHHRRQHHRRHTLSSVPNSICIFIYRLWTHLCSCEKNDPIEASPISTVTMNENGKPIIIGNDANKQDHTASDSEDELQANTSSYHSGIITRAFFPMRLVLMIIGRWPFLLILKSVATNSRKKSGTQSKIMNRIRVLNYNASLKSPIWIYFGLTTLFICFALIMSTLGFFDFFLEWNFLPERRWATIQNTFRNNLVMFLLVWGCLLHSTVSSFSMFINRKRVTRALNFWNVAVEELQIGKVKSHRRFIIIANFGYVFFLVLIYFAYSWWNIRFVRDGATLFGTLAIRPLLNEEQLNNTDEWKVRVFGICMIIYCVYASRAFLFIFCFKCRILRTLFRLWNERLAKYLRRTTKFAENGKDAYEDEVLEKKESSRLLRDMTILLSMVRQMDYVFATVLQSYYAIQLLNMCFELYMLAKSGTKEFVRSDESSRIMDIVSALITLAQNVYFFFTVSLDGACVGEEAAEGLHILKRHPISPHCSVYRKYLVYNLTSVYQHRIVLTAGKYFTINRPLIITVLGAVLTYFVIILQVEPSLNKDRIANRTMPQ